MTPCPGGVRERERERLRGLYERERERRRLVGEYERERERRRLVGDHERACEVLDGVYEGLLLLCSLDLDDEGDEDDEDVWYPRRLCLLGSWTAVTIG